MLHHDRRSFLTGAIASLGLAAAGGRSLRAWPQSPAPAKPFIPNPFIIDMHHHFAPPVWLAGVKGRPLLQPAALTWTPAKSVEEMDRGGVAASIVSITNPGLWFGDQQATNRLARACNEYGAQLVQDYPGRFGLFAAMPLPDADSSLKEITYALDTLKADGVGLITNYGDTWLGNPAYRPVMEELNRRKALVHVHPTAANCCRNLDYVPDVGPASMEYGTDTTRAIMGITFSGDAARYPDIRFIFSHAGGTAPFLAERIAGAERNLKNREQRLPHGFLYELKRFNYDVAGAANPGAMASLLKLVTPAQIVFGTDFPTGGSSVDISAGLARIGFSDAELHAIKRDNALRLIPRLNA